MKIFKKIIRPRTAAWITLIAVIIYTSLSFADGDVYYHLTTGRYILNYGIPYENPFTFVPGLHIVVQNWLYDTVMAWIYNLWHSPGMILFMLLQSILLTICLLEFFHYRTSDHKTAILLGVLCVIGIHHVYINLRPEVLTTILCLLQIIVIERYDKTDNPKWLAFIPLIMLTEINIHASYWFIHLVLLLPYLVPSVWPSRIQNKRLKHPFTIMIIFTASLYVMMLNPYGRHGITYVFDSLQSGIFDIISISEQSSPAMVNVNKIWIYGIPVLIVFVCLFIEKKLDSVSAYMFIGTFGLFVWMIKWDPMFAIGGAFVIRRLIEICEDKHILPKKIKPVIPAVILLCMTISTIILSGKNLYEYPTKMMNNDSYMTYGYTKESGYYNDIYRITDWLDENDPNAKILTTMECGNYFEFKEYPIYHDARPEIYTANIAGTNIVTDTIQELFITHDPHPLSDEYAKIIKSTHADYIFATDQKYIYQKIIICLTSSPYAEKILEFQDDEGTTYYLYKNLLNE